MVSRIDKSIEVDGAVCERCGSCVSICPLKIFSDVDGKVVTDRTGRCIKCGHCVSVCPTGAIEHSALTVEKFESIGDESVPSFEDVELQFKTRRTCRCFLDEPIAKEEIEKLIHSSRFAPTAANAQNVRYIVLSKPEPILELRRSVVRYYRKLEKQLNNPIARFGISLSQGKKIVEAYRYHMATILENLTQVGKEDRLFWGAPVVIIGIASGVAPIASAACNMSAMQIMLAAEAMGFGTCYNGYTLTALNRDKNLRQAMGIPKGAHPASVIAVGRPDVKFRLIPPRRKQRIIWFD